ncbi:MAG: NAD(P)-dependent oxidoreductase [Pseudomonadota bacterium]
MAALLALDEPWQKLERGASLGIVGYGHVGKRLKSVADRMGWSVKVYDPPVAARLGSERKHSFAFCSLEELLESEIISVHCSLTYGAPNPSFCLFDESVFSCLDSSQTVINASRGEVFDWSALRKHLASSNPVNLVVDVWENEPKVDPELLDDQAIKLATPHIAGYSLDAKLEATRMLWQGMADIGLVSPISLHFDHDLAQRSKELTSPVRSSKELLERHYRIREDDRKMRGLLRATREDVDLSFDELRRNYPLRREVAKLEQLPVDEEARLLIKKDVARLLEALTQSA